MRIAVVGAATNVHALARSAAVAQLGHEVRLVTVGPVAPVSKVDVKTRPVPTSPAAALLAARTFLQDVRSFRPDLLHLHYAGGRLGTLALLTRASPLVVTVMGGDVLAEQHPAGWPPLERRATRRILQQADAVLAKSDALRSAITAVAGPIGNVHTVRWGVDPQRFQPSPEAGRTFGRRLGLDERDRVILSPRHLQPLYNVHLLVEALPEILRSCPRALLAVADYNGDPAYGRDVRALAERLGVGERVRTLGRVDPADMPALYSLSEVMVSVASSDGLPQAMFEAMACGAPMVLGRLPALQEVVEHERTCLFVDVVPAEIARVVSRLLSDDALRQALSSRARARVEEVAFLPRELRRVDAIYRALAAAPRRSRRWTAALALDAASLLLR